MKPKNTYHFIENALSLFSVKAIDLILAILLIPYLILKVGIVNYGKYAFALSLVLLLVNITNYGFNLTAVRELARYGKDSKKLNKLFNEVFSVKLYLTGFVLLLLLLLTIVVPSFAAYKLVYIFASFLIVGDLFSLRWFFMGLEKMKYIPAIYLGGTLLYVLLVVIFIKQPADFEYIILLEGIGLFIANIISFSYIVLEYKIKFQLLSFAQVKNYVYTNWSSFINLFIPSMLSNTAIFMVGLFSIPVNVSIIQLGVKVSNAFATVNAVFTKVFYAMVNRKIQIMRQSFNVLLVIGVLLSVVMFFSADIVIKPWLNIKDVAVEQQISFIIKLLSPTPFLMAIISAYGVNGLLVLKKDNLVSKITIIATLVGTVVGLLVIPVYTFIGGAVFLITTKTLYAFFSFLFFKRNIRVK
ncbi:oligosaccharide flippase family protein [Lutibacter sp.]|uniref:oligosaccharide flippase family protein n=1 Tax=Lutibacter sp. TaxID=1925666 RepID=UPI0025BD83DE|nr:oligosaccharide flippase family protein [Lutibacter sp.]MCF6168476.1 oligosaccharide flippase family protein [Lutibacter sp.]